MSRILFRYTSSHSNVLMKLSANALSYGFPFRALSRNPVIFTFLHSTRQTRNPPRIARLQIGALIFDIFHNKTHFA